MTRAKANRLCVASPIFEIIAKPDWKPGGAFPLTPTPERLRSRRMNKALKKYLAKIGAKGGRVKSARKTAACRANAMLARKRPVKVEAAQ